MPLKATADVAKEQRVAPLIGITTFDEHKNRSTYLSININYTYSVSAAGGVPVALPGLSGLPPGDDDAVAALAASYVERLDGLVLSGGGDVCPYLYGEAPAKAVSRMELDRDRWELALFKAAWAAGLPLLGICRGCQLVNVALGGTLYQDIPSQLPGAGGHSFDVPMDEPAHYIEITAGTRLAEALGAGRFLSNSFHHQAAKDLAPGLSVSARADDGVVEGIEWIDDDRYLVAAQFHPEGMTRRFPGTLGLFRSHVRAAEAYARGAS